MGTKTITITDEAYEWLKSKKDEKSSFSDVIVENFSKRSWLELAGTLSDKEAEELRNQIRKSRKKSKKRMDKITELIK